METTDQDCRVFDDKSIEKIRKRRIVTDKECERDLKGILSQIFIAANQGIDKYNTFRLFYKQNAKVRGFDASMLNSSIIEGLQETFPDNCKWGKYKRFILRTKAYTLLVKKLAKDGLPMNVKTKNSEKITNQMQTSLFNNSNFKEVEDPIIFIGYEVDKLGEVCNLRLVYIDEGKLKWEITQDQIFKSRAMELPSRVVEENETLVSLKNKESNKDVI